MSNNNPLNWMTAKEAAAYLNISKRSMYNLAIAGALPHWRFGKKGGTGPLRFRKEGLDAFIESRVIPGASMGPRMTAEEREKSYRIGEQSD